MVAASDITFQRERLSPAFWGEVLPLLHAHHSEVVTEADAPALEVDVERYDLLDAADALRVYTARAGADLVGYASFVVGPSRMSKRHRVAIHDVLYLKPEHRGIHGLQLVLFADRELAREGVNRCRQSARPESTFGEVLCRVGYHLAECTYEKELSP